VPGLFPFSQTGRPPARISWLKLTTISLPHGQFGWIVSHFMF
jgi:hypothetical protein